MRKFLDNLDLASLSFVYLSTAIFALPGELDPITTGFVHPTLHAMSEELTLDERENLGLVVIDMRRPATGPIQCYAIYALARRLFEWA